MVIEKNNEKIIDMIKELKTMCATLGLANTGDEYKIISELFTYKFLNDKLQREYEMVQNEYEDYEEFIGFVPDDMARIPADCTIEYLYHLQNEDNFSTEFDSALVKISEENADIFSVETASGAKKPLFEPMSTYIRDEDKELELAKRAINILVKYQFDKIYDMGWDFFSQIFEFLIKDYNKDSGKYAEYFTPVSAGVIMARITCDDQVNDKVTIYDPAAGSGTLLLCMANEVGVNNCTIYSQDISQKSTQFLRVNLILNRLVHSLHNVIEGDTLRNPFHKEGEELKTFDIIVSNPPFNMDFSNDVKVLEGDKYDRFFAGIPNVPNKKKESMAIYQMFLQHIIKSLNAEGRAAVVVPTGFISKTDKISKKIRQKLIDSNWLKGVISLPSNVFATTGTNVSLIIIDKRKIDDKVFLVDASELGEKVSLEDGQRTLLNESDVDKIVGYFKERKEENGFSVLVDNDQIKENNYSFSAGQYFAARVSFEEISKEEYEHRIENYTEKMNEYFSINEKLQKDLIDKLKGLKYV